MKTFRTQRLLLRPFQPGDEDFLQDLHSRPEVQRWLGDGIPQPGRDQAEERLDRYRSFVPEPVHGIWAVAEATDGHLLGTLLLKSLPATTAAGTAPRPSGHTEIGWHFHPEAWGHGYATEAAAAVLAHAFEAGLDHVLAVTHPENTASQQVAARIGMADQGLTEEFYGVTCRLFRAERP